MCDGKVHNAVTMKSLIVMLMKFESFDGSR